MSTAVVYTCDCCRVPFDGSTPGRIHLYVSHYFSRKERVIHLGTFCSYYCLRSYAWEVR